MRWSGWTAALALLVGAAGCGGDDGSVDDGGSPDAGVGTDGGGPGEDAATAADGGEPGDDSGAGSGSWEMGPELPVTIQEISAAVVDGEIWIAGGYESPTEIVATVRVLDPVAGSWRTGPDLPFPRHHMALVAVGRDLYALGGMNERGFDLVDTAWVLRSGASDWEAVPSLPEYRAAAIGVAIDGRIYLAGGQGRGGVLASSTLVYDPSMETWSTGADIPTPREHLAGFLHDGELWAVGGRELTLSTNQDVVEIYDPVADAWRDGPSMTMPRGGFGAAVLDGVAYAVGGERPDRALDEAERLDIAGGGGWEAIDPVPTPRHGHAMAAAAGRVWVVGGADSPIFAAVSDVESYAP